VWIRSLDWDEVRSDLVIGSCPLGADDLDRIRVRSGASALLSLQTDACRENLGIDYAAHRRRGAALGLVLENAPMRDFDPEDQRRRLPSAVHRLHGLLSVGHRVYVHCTAGVNRSPLTVLGYLTFVEGLETEAALDLIRGARRQADPYLDAHEACRGDLVARLADLIEARAAGAGAGPRARSQAETAVLGEAITRPDTEAGRRMRELLA
jgi:predicted protein tyrosine phosphatase